MKRIIVLAILVLAVSFSGMAQENMMSGGKVDFTSLEDAQEMARTIPTVLFFYASWCPFCRDALAEIDGRPDELEGVSVVVVNYDREKELRRKYGITYQHTYVQIDEKGEVVALWSGGGVDEILENVMSEVTGAMN